MSEPNGPGPVDRIKQRYSAKPMGAAYQASMEAVFSIVIAVLLGWWADSYFETAPWGVLVGATIGFGAFVLRLTRLGAAMNAPEADEKSPPAGSTDGDKTESHDRHR